MSDNNTKLGYSLSMALHIGVAVAAIVATLVGAIFHTEKPEPPKPFDMVEPPAELPQPQSPQKAEPTPQLEQPLVDKIDPIKLPEPMPEPEPEPTPPEPTPPEPTPEPTPTPSPKPVKKTEKPKAVEKPKSVNYRDFLKNKPPKKASSATTTTRTQKPIVAPSITAATSNLDKIGTISSTVGESATTKAALSTYLQLINSLARRSWAAPESTMGMTFSARVSFSVSASGQISNVVIIKGSGNADFDRSVITVLKTLSIPPPPDRKSRNVTLTFETED